MRTGAAEPAGLVADLVVQIYAIHQTIIAETGGTPGLLDGAMLHAAAARPFATFAGAELYADDFEKAAALFHSLVKSHPFLDATAATALAAALYLLAERGHPLPQPLPGEAVFRFCRELTEESLRQAEAPALPLQTIPALAAWFRRLCGQTRKGEGKASR